LDTKISNTLHLKPKKVMWIVKLFHADRGKFII
jgi:hypothetical protein